MSTLSGNILIVVKSNLSIQGEDGKVNLDERFYINEYNDKRLAQWEEKMEKYKDYDEYTRQIIMDQKEEMFRNDPYIKDYFDYED